MIYDKKHSCIKSIIIIFVFFTFITLSINALYNYCISQKNKKYDDAIKKLEETDKVICTHTSDNFGWKEDVIFKAYKKGYGFDISREESKHEYIDINYKKIASLFPNADNSLKNVRKVEYSWKDFEKSDYFFISELDIGILEPNQYNNVNPDTSKYVFYILDDKYIISNNHQIIDKDFTYVDIYDIESETEYLYPDGIIANQPSSAGVNKYYIVPRYVMDTKNRIYCIYKYGNRLLCHRIN